MTRWEGPRLWLQVLGVFPLLLGAWFLATDPVRGLVLDPASATGDAAAVGAPAPVVLVVLDEFPLASILDADDRIDPEQFPNLAHLADDATWFRNATGVSPTTPEAVPPILTGRYPDAIGVLPTAEEHPNNIFTLLQGTYGFHVQESVTQLCPAHLCAEGALATGNPLAELTRDALDLWQRQLFGGGDDRQVDFAIRQSDPDAPTTINEFAAGIGRGDRPELDVLHAVYPHQPWYHLPSGLTYEAPFIAEGLDQYAEYAWKTDFAAETGRQRHLLQARHADVMLGVILARLQELDTYDDSLIVVTADHGAAFETGEPIRGVSEANADSVLWVPLLVKPPRQTTGRIDDRPARTIDVLPTMADVLELDLPDGTDGVSLLGPEPATGPDERRVYDWGFNRLEPNADGYSLIDGTQGFADLLAQPAPGEGDDPDLRFYRFGRHADLVGRRVDDLPAAPELDIDVAPRRRRELPELGGRPAGRLRGGRDRDRGAPRPGRRRQRAHRRLGRAPGHRRSRRAPVLGTGPTRLPARRGDGRHHRALRDPGRRAQPRPRPARFRPVIPRVERALVAPRIRGAIGARSGS